MTTDPLDLASTFAILTPSLAAEPRPVTPDIYQELDGEFDGFAGHTLVSLHEFAGDWPVWEMHPAGDEVVILLSGAATFVLRTDDGDVEVELDRPGCYVIVPRGTWHTARVSTATRMVFITPGEGTENRDQP